MKLEDAKGVITENLGKKIKTWDDFYAEMEKMADTVLASGHPAFILNAFFALYSFVLAMRDNPEEGDITKLVSTMIDYMTVQCEEKLKTKLVYMSAEENAKESLKAMVGVLQAVSGLQQAVEDATETTPETLAPQGIAPKKTLH